MMNVAASSDYQMRNMISADYSLEILKVFTTYQETSEYQTLLGESKEISQWYVDINTIEDLVALENETHHSLIVNNGEIVIYDDYVE